MDYNIFIMEYKKKKIKKVRYSETGCWRADWKGEQGRKRGKSFLVNKYGFIGS